MRRLVCSLVLALCVLVVSALPAHAQATRTWVSGVGDDANPCSRTAPCHTFAGAISKTAANGEINVLDPGSFGAVTITKSITISSQFEAGILASGTNGIMISLPADSDRVVLEGLDLEGFGTGLNGVTVIGKGKVTIRRTNIHNFTLAGVNMAGAANARVYLENVFISANGTGISVNGASGVANKAFIFNSFIDDNNNYGLQVTGPSVALLSGTAMSGGPVGIDTPAGGQVISYRNNILRSPGLPTVTFDPQ